MDKSTELEFKKILDNTLEEIKPYAELEKNKIKNIIASDLFADQLIDNYYWYRFRLYYNENEKIMCRSYLWNRIDKELEMYDLFEIDKDCEQNTLSNGEKVIK